MALGVDEWRDEREDRKLEQEYLLRLLEDLDTNLRVLDAQQESDLGKIANARIVFPLVAKGDWQDLSRGQAVVTAYLASPSDTPDWVDDTFEELKSIGRLGLLQNPAIRTELLAYYRALEVGNWAYQLMSMDYRDAIRSRMHPDLQLEIRTRCVRDRPHCELSLEGYDVDEFLDWLAGNQELAEGLRRVIVQWTRGKDEYLPKVRSSTNELKASIEAEFRH